MIVQKSGIVSTGYDVKPSSSMAFKRVLQGPAGGPFSESCESLSGCVHCSPVDPSLRAPGGVTASFRASVFTWARANPAWSQPL